MATKATATWRCAVGRLEIEDDEDDRRDSDPAGIREEEEIECASADTHQGA